MGALSAAVNDARMDAGRGLVCRRGGGFCVGREQAPAVIHGRGHMIRLFFTGAAAAGRFLFLLLLHGSGRGTLRTLFGFAPAFLGRSTFFTFKYSHFVLLICFLFFFGVSFTELIRAG
jgi:hypothetical protein